jgi:hypothetical protein
LRRAADRSTTRPGAADDGGNGGGANGGGDDGGEDQDADGDGYDKDDDCNDDDPTIHPGAEETCDGVDENCNDDIDDGVKTGIYFPDLDGMGTARTCPSRTPHSTRRRSTDAIRRTATRSAGSTATTRTIDQPRCHRSLRRQERRRELQRDLGQQRLHRRRHDEALLLARPRPRWLRRCGLQSTYKCDPTDAYPSDNNSDCDDEDATVNPSIAEICSDGVDNDCNGTIDICEVVGEYNLARPERAR